jgi:hypothetical protein
MEQQLDHHHRPPGLPARHVASQLAHEAFRQEDLHHQRCRRDLIAVGAAVAV